MSANKKEVNIYFLGKLSSPRLSPRIEPGQCDSVATVMRSYYQ
jgi:hypothetical protein